MNTKKETRKAASEKAQFKKPISSYNFKPFFRTIKEKGITRYKLVNYFGLEDYEFERLQHDSDFSISKIVEIMGMIKETDLNRIIEVNIKYSD